MKNSVFWDIETQCVPHRKHITSPLQRGAGEFYVKFEIFTVVTIIMDNAVFWDVMPCSSCKSQRFGGNYRFHNQNEKNRRARKTISGD
jgi:hypothetical protein